MQRVRLHLTDCYLLALAVPDWAIAFKQDKEKHVYFIAVTIPWPTEFAKKTILANPRFDA